MRDSLEITCPCCSTMMVVDRTSGAILLHKQPKTERKKDLLSMMSELDTQKSDREQAFEKQMASQKERERLLEARFREAFDRAEKDGKRMPNPLDLD